MRKVSKSRIDDDGVSSTNGSISNEISEQAISRPSNDEKVEDDETDAELDADKNGDHEDDLGQKKSKNKSGNQFKKMRTVDADDNEGSDAEADKKGNDDDNYNPKVKPAKKNKNKIGKNKAKKSKLVKKVKNKDEENDEKEEEEYEVEKIVDSKKIRGKLHYLIRWKGYSASSDSWEPEDTLSCPDLINKFTETHGNDSSPVQKRKGRPTKASKPAKKSKLNIEWDSENADEHAEYEVEKILEVHHKKNGKREFLIHWKGWSSKFDSWEPEKHLNCTDLIKKFMEKVSVARTSESKSLRVNPEMTNRFTLQAPSSGRRLSKRRGQKQRVRYDNAE